MDTFIVTTILGLVVGAVYAIAASGLVLTYTTSGILNFAHGAQAMLGTPHCTVNCQYRNAPSMACAPCAKFRIPDVVYVSTNPDAAIA